MFKAIVEKLEIAELHNIVKQIIVASNRVPRIVTARVLFKSSDISKSPYKDYIISYEE